MWAYSVCQQIWIPVNTNKQSSINWKENSKKSMPIYNNPLQFTLTWATLVKQRIWNQYASCCQVCSSIFVFTGTRETIKFSSCPSSYVFKFLEYIMSSTYFHKKKSSVLCKESEVVIGFGLPGLSSDLEIHIKVILNLLAPVWWSIVLLENQSWRLAIWGNIALQNLYWCSMH
jgi:hypothetical protein